VVMKFSLELSVDPVRPLPQGKDLAGASTSRLLS
jgi:hypothetical protein